MRKKDIKRLINCLGGAENINNITHCMTRLRLKIKNSKLIDHEAIKNIPGVIQEQFSGSEYQIVFGTKVEEVFKELKKQLHGQDLEQFSWYDLPSKILLPALNIGVAASWLQGFTVLGKLIFFSQQSNSIYSLIIQLCHLCLLALPVLFAWSAAKALKISESAAIIFGLEFMLLAKIPQFVQLHYLGNLLPPVMTVLIFYYVFCFLKQRVTGLFGQSFNFTISLVVSSVLGICLIGPVFAYLDQAISHVLFIINRVAWPLIAIIVSVGYLWLVTKGQHWWLTFLGLNNLTLFGLDFLFPLTSTAHFAQAGALVAIKLAHPKQHQAKLNSALKNALFCIIEPALYDFNLQKKSRFYSTLFACAISSIFLAAFGARNYAFPTSFLSFVNPNNPTWHWIILGLISIFIAFSVSLTLVYVFEKIAHPAAVQVVSAIKGKVSPISKASDLTFASGKLGRGVIVEPQANVCQLYAPISGKIVMIAPDNHAFGIQGINGVQILVHVGIDTVKMKKPPVRLNVKENDLVKCRQRIGVVNVAAINKTGFKPETMIVILNSQDYLVKNGKKQILFTIREK